jgi:hypothetical protein
MIIKYLTNKCENDMAPPAVVFSIVGIAYALLITTLPDFPLLLKVILSLIIGFFYITLESTEDERPCLMAGSSFVISSSILLIVIEGLKDEITYPLWMFAVGFIVSMEILFLLDRSTPAEGESIFWFTTKRKIEAFIETLVIVFAIKGLNRNLTTFDASKYYPIILETLKYIGLLIGALAIIYIYIWINTWKFRRNKK